MGTGVGAARLLAEIFHENLPLLDDIDDEALGALMQPMAHARTRTDICLDWLIALSTAEGRVHRRNQARICAQLLGKRAGWLLELSMKGGDVWVGGAASSFEPPEGVALSAGGWWHAAARAVAPGGAADAPPLRSNCSSSHFSRTQRTALAGPRPPARRPLDLLLPPSPPADTSAPTSLSSRRTWSTPPPRCTSRARRVSAACSAW